MRKEPRRSRAVTGPIAAGIAAALLLVGVGAVALHESNQAISQDALAKVESNRDAAIRAVERQSTDLKRTITAFAAEPDIAAGLASPTNLAGAREQMRLLAQSKGAPAVILSDLAGRTRAVYPAMPGVMGQDFSYRDWFKGAERTGKPYVSAGYRSVAPGAPLAVGIATPITTGGKRVGYLTIVGQLDAVRAVAEHARHDDGVIITVTDQTGQRLASPLSVDDRDEPLDNAVDRGTREALAGRTRSIIGDQDLAASAPVPGVGWTVTASLPKDVALAPATALRRSLGITLGACLLMVIACTGFALRLTRRRAAEHDEVEIERARLTTLFAASPVGIVECDADTTILSANDAMTAMLGYEPGELIGTSSRDLVRGRDLLQLDGDVLAVASGEMEQFSRERIYLGKDGRQIPVHVSVIPLREDDGRLRHVVSFIVDQSDQKRIEDALRASEDRLTQLALHDDLTGLPNRRLLLSRCTDAFTYARTAGVDCTTIAALFIDLDGFKPVNDLQGHERGDQLLVEIATDLLAVVRPTDTVARVGGDEFVVLLGSFEGVAHLHEIAERVTRAVRREVTDGSTALPVTASVGVASIDLAVEPLVQPDQLLSRADAAMYRAKELGRDRHDVFAPGADPVSSRIALPPPRAVLH